MKTLTNFFKELFTPSNKIGPAEESYRRGAEGVWHGALGGAFMWILSLVSIYIFPLAYATMLGITFVLYGTKEIIDYKNGGRKNDCFEDIFTVMFGAALYNISFFPIAILLLGVVVTLLHIYFGSDKS